MRTGFYTISKNDLSEISGMIPDYVLKKAVAPGSFNLAAVAMEGEKEYLAGMCQFLVNKVADNMIVGELSYIYVFEESRRKEVGIKLLDKMCRILDKSGADKTLVVIIPEEAETLGYELTENEMEEFLRESDFLPEKGSSDYWDVAERDLFSGIPEITLSGTKRYVRRNA